MWFWEEGRLGAQRPTADWPQWRGPNRDGSAPSFTAPKTWPENLTQRWKVDIGLGYATPVVVGNRVYTFSRRDENEVVAALDAASGKQIWHAQYPAPYTLVKAAASHGMGPKSTPAFADGRLFTLGISGILSAFDAATGKLLWQKPAPAVGPTFSTSQSPIVDRGLLIVHVGGNKEGGLTAFDPATGNQRWVWNGDGPGYGSPVVAEIAGTRQVIVPTYQNLVGVSAETGELLWKRPFKARSDVNAITPLVSGETVIASGVEVGVVAVRISKQGTQWSAEDAWLNEIIVRPVEQRRHRPRCDLRLVVRRERHRTSSSTSRPASRCGPASRARPRMPPFRRPAICSSSSKTTASSSWLTARRPPRSRRYTATRWPIPRPGRRRPFRGIGFS